MKNLTASASWNQKKNPEKIPLALHLTAESRMVLRSCKATSNDLCRQVRHTPHNAPVNSGGPAIISNASRKIQKIKKNRIRNVITQQQHLSVDDCSTTQHHPVALWCIIGRSIANWQSARVRCAPTTAHNNLNTNTHTRIKVTAQIIPTDAHTHNGAARIAKEEKRQSSAVSCCLRSTVI